MDREPYYYHAPTIERAERDRFPLCSICGGPSALVTPERRAYCGECWRKQAQSNSRAKPRRVKAE